MNVSLTDELRKYVEDKVASGLYHSASEVIREGLRLLAEQDRLREMRLKEVRKKIKEGLDQLDRGEGRPADEVFARLEARIAKIERERARADERLPRLAARGGRPGGDPRLHRPGRSRRRSPRPR